MDSTHSKLDHLFPYDIILLSIVIKDCNSSSSWSLLNLINTLYYEVDYVALFVNVIEAFGSTFSGEPFDGKKNQLIKLNLHYDKMEQCALKMYTEIWIPTLTLTWRCLVVKVVIYILMLLIFSTPVLISHLWQFETVIFLHWCLIRSVLFVLRY